MFGLGFGMVGQVLIAAVQNSVPRADLGVAMATTSFFRGLGGAVGAAALGAIFTARTGVGTTAAASLRHLSPGARADVIHGVQAVFLTAAPIAAIALIVVLLLAGRRVLIDDVRKIDSALARRSNSIGSSRAPGSLASSVARTVPGRIRPSAGGVSRSSPSTIQTFA